MTLIYIKFDFVFIPVISHALITMFCRKRTIQASAEDYDTHSDGEWARALQSPETMSTRKRNSKGLVCLRNGNVAMRDLDLASRISTKTRDDDADKMFHAKLTLSKALPSHLCKIIRGPALILAAGARGRDGSSGCTKFDTWIAPDVLRLRHMICSMYIDYMKYHQAIHREKLGGAAGFRHGPEHVGMRHSMYHVIWCITIYFSTNNVLRYFTTTASEM